MMRIRAAIVIVCLCGVLFLWVPPVRSEAHSPPPPLLWKPASAVVLALAALAVLAAPLPTGGKALLAVVLIGSTVLAWLMARVLWAGFFPV